MNLGMPPAADSDGGGGQFEWRTGAFLLGYRHRRAARHSDVSFSIK